MSTTNGQPTGQPFSIPFASGNKLHRHVSDDGQPYTQTPNSTSNFLMPEAPDPDEDGRRTHFSNLFRKYEARVNVIFAEDGSYNRAAINALKRPRKFTPALSPSPSFFPATAEHAPIQEPPRKKAKRVIDEDDYGDDDEDEDESGGESAGTAVGSNPAHPQSTLLLHKSSNSTGARFPLSPSKSGSSPVASERSPGKQAGDKSKQGETEGEEKSSEAARKELEEARNATEEAVKRSFHTIFYTLENDRMAMLEQQQLEESEKQLQAEMDKTGHSGAPGHGSGPHQGSLSSTNLGASSLTLKHLIAQIDAKRDQVKASDAELRSLMNEVRKNRSKWANEEHVGQEELYEALEKVLSELKAHTEYSTPFLNRVNKRDAPDYAQIIKNPMDLGTMTKKLKGLQYKSKADFVNDLNLIWDNCLKYNHEMTHPLRRNANGMRKEAEKLIPLIPDIVIRPRAEVEAEERRKQNGGEDDAGEDSEDEPIMASRGRAATKGNKSRKAPPARKEGTPNGDQKPVPQLNGLLAKPNRESSEVEGSGFATPIGGNVTPSGAIGHSGVSSADAMDIDGPSLNGMTLVGEAAEQEHDDEEYKIWKQVTKKDRALLAKERYHLFANNQLNPNEPALLRNKAGMRRFLKARRETAAIGALRSAQADGQILGAKPGAKPAETLAEGMEEEQEDRNVPDYYEPQSVIPDLPPNLQWVEDSEGVINAHEDYLRLVPPGYFTAPKSAFTDRIDANIRQIQDTRKLCSKISIIKQMQIQTQVYTSQFPKYNPVPFVEADIEGHFLCGEGPVMVPEVCRAALQRSVAKLCYHAGFEELQPSALDCMTDMASDYFQKLVRTFATYQEAEKVRATGVYGSRGARFQPRFTQEEVILHTLNQHGYDPDTLETYVREDSERLSNKLQTIHRRMKDHLTDLLRPALQDAGPDGDAPFDDGSDQFISGDFAGKLDNEDFFGFKALGLDLEIGLENLSVPLHLLQSRVRSQYHSQTQSADSATADLIEQPPPYETVTVETMADEIGIVKNFFLAKLHANNDQPLLEDEDLPVKQRRPRPRLGATGRITFPQKRPPKEQIALAKKKKKLDSGAAQVTDGVAAAGAAVGDEKPEEETPSKKAKAVTPLMERADSAQSPAEGEDKDDGTTGMMSPESIER